MSTITSCAKTSKELYTSTSLDMFNKKPKEPLTEEEEQIKHWKAKHLKIHRRTLYFVILISFIGIALYLHGTITAGDYVVMIIPMWFLSIVILMAGISRLQRYTTKVYFESILYSKEF